MRRGCRAWPPPTNALPRVGSALVGGGHALHPLLIPRSEEHTSELQSQSNLVCRHLLEKKYVQARVLGADSAASRDQPRASIASPSSARRPAHNRGCCASPPDSRASAPARTTSTCPLCC